MALSASITSSLPAPHGALAEAYPVHGKFEGPKASGSLTGSPEANHTLCRRGHQLGEIHPRTLDVRRCGNAVGPEAKQDQCANRRPFEADGLAEDQDRIEAVAMDQIVEAGDLHPRHRGERGDRLLV